MHLLKQWNFTWLNFTSSDVYQFKLAQNPTQRSFLDHSLQRNWFIRVPKSRCTTNKPGKTNKPLGIKQMSRRGGKKWEKRNSLGKVRKNLPVGRMHSFRFQTLPHLDFLMFHLPSSPSFFIFTLFPFFTIAFWTTCPAHIHQLSSFAFAFLFKPCLFNKPYKPCRAPEWEQFGRTKKLWAWSEQ